MTDHRGTAQVGQRVDYDIFNPWPISHQEMSFRFESDGVSRKYSDMQGRCGIEVNFTIRKQLALWKEPEAISHILKEQLELK